MHFRPFRNTDPPHLARIWSRQLPSRGYARQISPQLLDIYVLAKPFFDRDGLIVAEQNNEVVGFVHAGFGPNESLTDLSYEMGVTCMLMVDPNIEYDSLAPALLQESESYLRAKGAKVLYGGCMYPLNPFYLGLYGGSESPGVLLSDKPRTELFQANGYEEADRCVVLQRSLDGFRAPVDRRLLKLKRSYQVEHEPCPSAENWWEACVGPLGDPRQFELYHRGGGPSCGRVRFWVIDSMSQNIGRHSVGLTNLSIDEAHRGQGLATFLNAEAMKQLQMGGVGLVEAQTMATNASAIGLYKKLGFQEVDQGIVFRKKM